MPTIDDEEVDKLLSESGALRSSYSSKFENGYIVPFEILAEIVEKAFALGVAEGRKEQS